MPCDSNKAVAGVMVTPVLTIGCRCGVGEGMPQNAITALVTDILARAPDWIRKDLAAKDPISRTRAEEALAALIGSALSKDDEIRKA